MFSMIKEKAQRIVGTENLIDDPDILKSYQSDFSFTDPMIPLCVVKPQNIDEVQSLIALANNTSTPLIPLSSGEPHFRGDTVPSNKESIIVDLSRLRKIIKIDRDYRLAMCEPGVTYKELITAVKEKGLRLNMPLLPKQSKSVVGSLLEREPVTMPIYHWDISDPLSCIEIIFGSGEIFRTGAAAGPGTVEEQWASGLSQNEAAGPSQASWHRMVQGAQGTMGIVTWASLRCEIIPKLEEPFIVECQQLDPLVEMVHWLLRLRLVNECFIMNNGNLSLMLTEKYDTNLDKLNDSLPSWILYFNIAGYNYLPEERINYRTGDIQKLADRLGLKLSKNFGSIKAEDILDISKKPSEEPYWKLRAQGSVEEIPFLAQYPNLNTLINSMHDTASVEGVSPSNIGVYLQPIVQGVNCHCEFNLFYDPSNPGEPDKIKRITLKAIPELINKGAFFSRPYGQSARIIYERDAATAKSLKKVKTIHDPNNIMNPGKLCF